MSTTIKTLPNDPVHGLLAQIDQVGAQAKKFSEFDLGTIGFNNKKETEDEQVKLYIPVEQYSNYPGIQYDYKFINLSLVAIILFIICAIITRR